MPAKGPTKADVNALRDAENAARDLKNWIFVFAREYDLPKEAVDTLHRRIDDLAVKIGMIAK